ncbi:hypothetical protein ACFY9N_00150 [Microbacterium sp. NPDC008134]|uniref:hypothetical protein n=1 Tax=Microbacterium sp. NPDC008134 TaxID=3364183 RepID=UPI0036ED05BC
MGLFRRKKREPEASASVQSALQGLVVPLLVGREWFAANEQKFAGIPDFPESAMPFARQITDELWATYATDAHGMWDVVQRGGVDAFGGADELHRSAVENLVRRVSGDLDIGGADGGYRLQTPAEADLAASLVLVPELWLDRVQIAGAPVLALPSRIGLVVCGADDADNVDVLRQYSDSTFATGPGKPVTTALHVLTPEGLGVLG